MGDIVDARGRGSHCNWGLIVIDTGDWGGPDRCRQTILETKKRNRYIKKDVPANGHTPYTCTICMDSLLASLAAVKWSVLHIG